MFEPRAGQRLRTASTWLWPIPIPTSAADTAWHAAGFAAPWTRGWRGFLAAVTVGMLPLSIAYLVGGSWHQLASAALLAPLLLGAVREKQHGHAFALIGITFFAHCALAIALSYLAPLQACACYPDAGPYWDKNLHWIRTGQDPEYITANWLPAHFQLLGVMVVVSYLSLGFIPMLQGFYEVDLMNFYVGRLLATSDGSISTLLLGWHPWSVLRGLCYTVIVVEVASWSLSRLTGRQLSTSRGRARRWGLAFSFFVLDCLVKYATLDTVRLSLEAHLNA